MSIILFIFFLVGCEPSEPIEKTFVLKTESIEISKPQDIVSLTDSLVHPILYSHIAGLDFLPLMEKKEKFISALLPAILVVKHQFKEQQERIILLMEKAEWQAADSIFYHELAAKFKSKDIFMLKSALETHPNSIVLAQAAVESGWGNSRIFAEANNLFGIWSYNLNEPRIASKIKRGDKTIYLRKYKDISQSIENYFVTLSRSNAYKEFRSARIKTDDVFELIPHLKRYSERREAYVAQLKTVIRFNGLRKYDSYQLHPDSFEEVEVGI